jgi:hypothetical protein
MYGGAAAILFVAGMGAYTTMDRAANYAPAKASVYLIDRKCNILETTTSPDGRKTARGLTDDCKNVEEWETVRTKRTKDVSGKAVMHVNYTAPQDGSLQTSKVEYDGRDDEFYDLKVGDEIDVLVSNDDPSKVIKG